MPSALSSVELAPWVERIKARREAIGDEITPARLNLYRLTSRVLSAPRRAVRVMRGTRSETAELQFGYRFGLD